MRKRTSRHRFNVRRRRAHETGFARQTTIAYLERVDEWQAELLKAACSGIRPRVIWDDEGDGHGGSGAKG